ncbi:hypothetical protein PFICI_03259 [Pestalotiopsis fici W106-1]|uniref:Uncharacterized protein n=1 Tax=Pestalotiopsis fici (strain W106-1 / CGMCC3.15140) TaxID=1229662 RepID=W3XGX4_PESFW|nr:uncharacterized protein PFICI_03259 [Pestalotiopsis fici W106-1]ETS85234.1 hypothetical protein PFICI_03259 [Pestalotiopsis fici W106-1]
MEDWEDAAFSSRHMHNRVGRNSGKGGGRSQRGGFFDVRKTFGSFTCKCVAWEKTLTTGEVQASGNSPVLELFRLTGNGQGIAGRLSLPGMLQASVILAASRKSLQTIVDNLEAQSDESGHGGDGAPSLDEHNGMEKDCDVIDALGATDTRPEDRFATFEKNSFRSPKFWLQWCGMPTEIPQMGGEGRSAPVETGSGYIVFSGNDCRKFDGTISCTSLDWDNVAIRGHKIASRSASDMPILWSSNNSAL